MNRLWVRLSLAFSGVVLVAVLIVVVTSIVLEQAQHREDFTAYVLQQPGGLVDQLAGYYQTQQGWAGVESMLKGAQAVYPSPDQAFFLTNTQQQILYQPTLQGVSTSVGQAEPMLMLPIQVNQQTVGYLGVTKVPEDSANEPRPSPLVRILGDVLLFIAAVGGVGGIVFGVVMSRAIAAPLNNLANAARAIGAHKLSERVDEKGSDELIAVARAFNEMAADLEQAEQLWRNLLSDVAHELRTPIAVLQANLRAILDEVYPLDQSEIVHLYEQSRLLSHLVDDLHLLAQAEARQLPLLLQETNLAELVRIAVDAFHPGAEAKDVTLQTRLPENSPAVEVDAARITQVLQNLLANALRHTPTGGTITVSMQLEPNFVSLSIADTGDGIPPEHLSHIFDRFYRTDTARSRDKGGAGLGLAIARAIVEAHGGRIEVTSQGIPGQGSKFTLCLPASNVQEPLAL